MPGVDVDVYTTLDTEASDAAPVDTPAPARGLPSLDKQLRAAEGNLAKMRGSDPTALATKAYLKEQIDKLKRDIYNSKSLAEQVVTFKDRVARAHTVTEAADKALKAAIEIRDAK